MARVWVTALTNAVSLIATCGCTVSAARLPQHDSPSSGTSGPRILVTRGVGVVIGKGHVALGWMRELLVQIPDPGDCRLVVVVETAKQLADLQSALASNSNKTLKACVFDEHQEKQ